VFEKRCLREGKKKRKERKDAGSRGQRQNLKKKRKGEDDVGRLLGL
jgi:hypothetical protein